MRGTTSQRFRQWLDTTIADPGRKGARLPQLSELARAWSLSDKTVRTIMREYRDRGLVSVVPGRGTFVGTPPAPQPPSDPAPRTASVECVRRRIVESISAGELKRGEPLPAVKLVANQFSVGTATVSRAYSALANDGYVCRVGRKYWVGRFSSLLRYDTRKEVVFLTWNNIPSPTGTFAESRVSRCFERFEQELLLNGFYLHFAEVNEFDRYAGMWRRRGTCPYGMVFAVVWGLQPYYALAESVHAFLKSVRGTRPRTAIVVGGYSVKTYPGVQVLNFGNILTAVARTMARCIHERGYKRAVLFVDDTQIPGADILPYIRVIAEMQHLDPHVVCDAVVTTPNQRTDAHTFLQRMYEHYPPEHLISIMSKYRRMSQAQVEALISISPSVEEALGAHRDCDVWLFSHADQAVRAQRWAADNGVGIPDDTAIIAFENRYDFLQQNISCCVADWETNGYLLAHAIIGDIRIQKTRHGYLHPATMYLNRLTSP